MNRFIQFISKGNVLDLAIGTVIGGAFTNIVTSFSNDLLGPFLELVSAHNIESAFYVLKPGKRAPYTNIQEAKADGAIAIPWGKFAQVTVNFFIQAMCIFLIIRAIDHIKSVPLQKLLR